MKRRIVALFLTACMSIGILAGCGIQTEEDLEAGQKTKQSEVGESGDGQADGGTEWDEEPAEVKWLCWALGEVPSDAAMEAVLAEINKITEEKINVTVDLEFLDMGTYMQQMPMMVTSSEKLDLVTTFPAASAHYSAMTAQNQLMPLNELLETEGADIKELLPDELLKATSRGGNIYSVPVYQSLATSTYWMARKSVFDELGFNAEELKTMDDIYEVLKACKEKYPDLLPLSGNSQNASPDANNGIFVETGAHFDMLGVSPEFAIVKYEEEGGETKVVNKYETEEFKYLTERLKQWYDEGLIDKDVATRQDGDAATNQKAFSWWFAGNNTRVQSQAVMTGEDVVTVKLGDSNINTTDATRLTMAIPTSATEPEAAMRLMNLLYTDSELKNLVDYGIEGVHYELDETGCVKALESEDGGYAPKCATLIGNSFLSYSEAGVDMEAVEKDKNAMETATYSPLMGFSFDVNAQSEVFAQLGNIWNEYVPGLKCGSAADGALDALNQKAKDAGLDAYLQEAQTQLDAWLAEQ